MKRIVLTAAALILIAGCADESADKYLATARDYLQKKDNKAAVIEIKNALQKNPELAEARFLLGKTYFNQGDVVAAEVELRKALAAKYPADQVVPELARSMVLLGQMKKLVDEFGQTRLDEVRANASLQTSLALAYAALGKPESAETSLRSALAADPNYAAAKLLDARRKAAMRDFDEALAIVDQVVRLDPGDAEAWQLRGDLLLYGSNELDEALVAYSKALAAKGDFLPAHYGTFTVLVRQGKFDQAEEELAVLKRFAGKDLMVKYLDSTLAFQRKDFKSASLIVQELLRAAPKDPRILQLAGAIELQIGSPGQAEVYLSRAVEAAPDQVLARRLLIVAYLRSGRPTKAMDALNALAARGGIDQSTYSLAGRVYLSNGDVKKAEEYFAKAAKLDPKNPGKRTALAVARLAERPEAAIGELEAIASDEGGVGADFALVNVHLRRREFDKALAVLDRMEKKQPDKPIAANLQGRVRLMQNDTAGARKSFERALSIDPDFFAAATSLAALDIAEKKFDNAKRRYEAMLARNPNNAPVIIALAQLASASGANQAEVVGLLNKAIGAAPSEAIPRLMLINVYMGARDPKQALAAAQSATAAIPNHPELLTALARAQLFSGDTNQAISTLGKVVSLQPLSPAALFRLAEAQAAGKDLGAAEQNLRKALELKPDLIDVQSALFMVLISQNKYREALEVARTVQKQRPAEATGFMLEGDGQANRKEWPLAIDAYRKALKLNESTGIAVKLHAMMLSSGNAGDASQFAQSWNRSHPKDAAFLFYLSSSALSRNDFAQAESYLQAVLKLQPDSAMALNNLAWVRYQMKRDDAVAIAERANVLAPNQPEFMDTWATLLSARGDHGKAVDIQAKAVDLAPSNPMLRLNLAKLYFAAGEKAKAKTELEGLAKLGDKFPEQNTVSALLRAL